MVQGLGIRVYGGARDDAATIAAMSRVTTCLGFGVWWFGGLVAGFGFRGLSGLRFEI